MSEHDWLAERFEENRPHLRAVAYRMLGSSAEADDAVQETWLRLSRAGAGEVENLAGWLTTIVARVSLNMLRSRTLRREEPMDPPVAREPVAQPPGGTIGSSRREVRERSMFSDTLATIVVSQPPRFSTPPVPERLSRSQVSCTASSASLTEPSTRYATVRRCGRFSSNRSASQSCSSIRHVPPLACVISMTDGTPSM